MNATATLNPVRAGAKVADQPDFIRPSQAAAILGKNPATVRRACASGAIKAVKFGSEWLINKAAFYEQFGL